MTGIALLTGAISVTAEVSDDKAALEEPAPFVAMTADLMKYPASVSETTYVLFVAEAIFE